MGRDISIVVQPSDFVKDLKKQLKKVRGYKDFIIQWLSCMNIDWSFFICVIQMYWTFSLLTAIVIATSIDHDQSVHPCCLTVTCTVHYSGKLRVNLRIDARNCDRLCVKMLTSSNFKKEFLIEVIYPHRWGETQIWSEHNRTIEQKIQRDIKYISSQKKLDEVK